MLWLASVIGFEISLYLKRGHATSTDESTIGLLGRAWVACIISLTFLFPVITGFVCSRDHFSMTHYILLTLFFLKERIEHESAINEMQKHSPNQSCYDLSFHDVLFTCWRAGDLKTRWRRGVHCKDCHVLKRCRLWHVEEVLFVRTQERIIIVI